MNFSSNRGFPAGNPIANALVVVVGALAIAASIVLGFFAFLLLASLVAVFVAIIGVRAWWFNRKLRRTAGSRRPGSEGAARTDVIEGEFSVVETRRRPSDREV